MKSSIRTWKNTSEFHDGWARPCVEWLASRCEFSLTLDVEIRRGVSISGSGRARSGSVFVRIRRRQPRLSWREHRFGWDRQAHSVRNAAEAFVWIFGHELHHASIVGRRESKEMSHSSYEYRANCAGDRAVEEFRGGQATVLRQRYAAYLRKQKARDQAAAKRESARRELQASAGYRIEKLLEQRARWESKARRARTALIKIRRRIAGIESAGRRAAAKGGPR